MADAYRRLISTLEQPLDPSLEYALRRDDISASDENLKLYIDSRCATMENAISMLPYKDTDALLNLSIGAGIIQRNLRKKLGKILGSYHEKNLRVLYGASIKTIEENMERLIGTYEYFRRVILGIIDKRKGGKGNYMPPPDKEVWLKT